jgi:N-succinyldiaminopimelate aminotransferase
MLNLGQGFPDFVPAKPMRALKEGVAEAMESNALNQYSPQNGLQALRDAIAHMFRVHYSRTVDSATEVCVVPSGTSGIFAAVQAFVNQGDEVVIWEPIFPWYAPCIRLAGGVPVPVHLYSPGFRMDRTACAAAFSSKTKLCILNSPHNPTGRVFDEEELAIVAEMCQQHDVVCLSDEVYAACVYPGAEHRSISCLPGMRERTLVLGSASKLLGVTGWRVGWVVGPGALVAPVNTAHSYMTCVLQDLASYSLPLSQ